MVVLTDDIDDVPTDFRWQIEVSLAILSSRIAATMSAGTYYGSLASCADMSLVDH